MNFRKTAMLLLLIFLAAFSLYAESVFEGVDKPVITAVYADEENPLEIVVDFELETDGKKVNKATVEMIQDGKVVATKTVGRSKKLEKKAVFEPAGSGFYTFIVKGVNNKSEETLDGEAASLDYSYPLFDPLVTVKNMGSCSILVSWDKVKEAKYYYVSLDGKIRRVDGCEIL